MLTKNYTEFVKEYVESRHSGPATITVNVTERCQLACPFCPHGHGYKPRGEMDRQTAMQLIARIKENRFSGRVSISGNGEPTLWPHLFWFLESLPEEVDKQVISNGITKGFDYERLGGMCRLVISRHSDAPLETGNARCIVRDCAPGSEDLKLTNRGGALGGEKENRGLCTFPFYKMFIDYDGSYLLCCDDWLRKSKVPKQDIFHLSLEEYFYGALRSKKQEIAEHGRIAEPCVSCTADGKLMGRNFVEEFLRSIQ